MKTKDKTDLLTGLLIDPYRQEVRRIEVGRELADWYGLLRCEMVEHVLISHMEDNDLDLWIDEEGLLKEPPPPSFQLVRGETAGGGLLQIFGYGLLLASREGEAVSLIVPPNMEELFVTTAHLRFERLNYGRLADLDFTDEQLRCIELEMPGRFRYLDHEN